MLYKILKYPFFRSYMVKWKNPLSAAEMKDWKQVRVKSKSGGTICGLFSEIKTAHPRATIVLGHPMGKEAKGYFLKRGYAEFLRDANYNVLVFDINGFGESSQGSFSYYEDIIAIGKKAQELTPDLPIGYHGISLGAMWSTLAFTDKSHPYTFAIIESAATTLDEFWKGFPTGYKMLQVLNFFLPKYTRHIKMIERIGDMKNLTSLLFIYSRDDEWVPFEMGERYLEKSPIASELWSVNSAKHAEIVRSKSREAYVMKILSFYDTALGTSTASDTVELAFLKQFTSQLMTSFDVHTLAENGLPTVAHLADKMNISPKYLSEILKALTGQSTLHHIHVELLRRAKDLIINSDKRMSAIAYELGFEYPQYFSSFFRHKTGISPTQFRSTTDRLILNDKAWKK